MMKKNAFYCALTLCGLALLGLTVTAPAKAVTFSAGSVNQQINATITAGAQPVTIENGNLYAGNFVGSTLNGVALPYVYCVDLSRNININSGPYNASVNLSAAGQIFGTAVPNAGKVAYLLNHYAATATTADQTAGLQAAIWEVMYGAQFTLNGPGPGTDAGLLTSYNTYITNVGSDPVTSVSWLSPFNSNGSPAQGLVTVSVVPEPGVAALLLTTGLTGTGLLLRRRVRRTV